MNNIFAYVEALEFVRDALSRLNNARTGSAEWLEIIGEELTDMENAVMSVLNSDYAMMKIALEDHIAELETSLRAANDRGYFDPHPDDSEEEADEKIRARALLAPSALDFIRGEGGAS